MFNSFFFGSQISEKAFQTFVRREGLVLVMDPPFGGLAEVLAGSVKTIHDEWKKAHSIGNISCISDILHCNCLIQYHSNVS